MRAILALTCILTLSACASPDAPEGRADAPGARAGAPATPVATAVPRADRPRIVVLGDSLAAGYGLERGESFPDRLQQRLDAAGYAFEVANISVSGDTSAGGLRRLDWALDGDVRVLIVELGGNDGLRGLPVDELKANLAAIITRARERGARVLLTGMEAPPNFGPAYTAAFRRVYRDLAAEHGVALLPFLLDGVAGDPALNIADGIHPNPQGARLVEQNVWRVLEPLLQRPS
ncbi:MAG: arylesterase [Vicinamibacterales bacterium]